MKYVFQSVTIPFKLLIGSGRIQSVSGPLMQCFRESGFPRVSGKGRDYRKRGGIRTGEAVDNPG